MALVDFLNRVRKDWRHRRKWAARQGLEAFRIYDRDMPEHAYAVDRYGDHVHVVHFPPKRRRAYVPLDAGEMRVGLAEVLEVPEAHVHIKEKTPQPWRVSQYEKIAEEGRRLVVAEQGLRFWVNLTDYVDTGLFLDHRLTRARVREEARGRRFLNLFAYTGAFSVYAADGGAASTTTVDLSNTYLDWARDNLSLNGFEAAFETGGPAPTHRLVRSDVLRWIHQEAGRARYDLVVLDPPSWSTSKKMVTTFNVQRDHVALLQGVRRLLAPGGVVWFSTHYRGFELDPAAVAGFEAVETTPASIPEDIRDRRIHRCWRLEGATH